MSQPPEPLSLDGPAPTAALLGWTSASFGLGLLFSTLPLPCCYHRQAQQHAVTQSPSLRLAFIISVRHTLLAPIPLAFILPCLHLQSCPPFTLVHVLVGLLSPSSSEQIVNIFSLCVHLPQLSFEASSTLQLRESFAIYSSQSSYPLNFYLLPTNCTWLSNLGSECLL